MDDRRIGRVVRAVRQRLELRQSDLAGRVGVSQTAISKLERGRLESVGLETLRRVAVELDTSITINANWRGGQGDRLLDRAHAAIVDHVVDALVGLGWEVVPEFSFNHFGDRGSVDILAWHPSEQILLIVAVKATLTDLQDLLASLSRKLRVVPALVREQKGWDADHVARILVIAGTAIFAASFPAGSRAVRSRLRRPLGALAGVWFVSTSSLGTGESVARARIRRGNGTRA